MEDSFVVIIKIVEVLLTFLSDDTVYQTRGLSIYNQVCFIVTTVTVCNDETR